MRHLEDASPAGSGASRDRGAADPAASSSPPRQVLDLPARLRCGVLLDDLIDQVADGTTPIDPGHQRTCASCRAALAELEIIWAPVSALAAEPVSAPPALMGAVMDRVRALSTSNWYAIVPDHRGRTATAAWVVAVIARRAAAGVPGVLEVRGVIAPAPAEDDDAPSPEQRALAAGTGVSGGTVVVSLTVTASLSEPLPRLTAQVRREVVAHVRTLTGLHVAAVDVLVVDVRSDGAREIR